jgi:mannosyl-3-phosphoglycerate phosphatase
LKRWKVRSGVSTDRGSGFMVFTDLDGTLLDHDTYRWDEAEPALTLCASHDVPVILVSSKTRAEINVLRFELGLASPFISENGGGIFFPVESVAEPPPDAFLDEDLWKWSLGSSYRDVVAALHEIREEMGWDIRGFADMTVDEISRITGLEPERARLAAMREYDEPFIAPHPQRSKMDALIEAASRRGLQVTEGGRFHHLHGACDKGEAVEKLVRWYEKTRGPVKTIALGDSPNDFAMLKRVDYPVLVRSSREYPGLEKALNHLRTTQEKGPAGWNAAVTALLTGKWN